MRTWLAASTGRVPCGAGVGAELLSIDAENGALPVTVAAAIQSQNAIADDCRDRLVALQADFDGVFYDRPSECDLRARAAG